MHKYQPVIKKLDWKLIAFFVILALSACVSVFITSLYVQADSNVRLFAFVAVFSFAIVAGVTYSALLISFLTVIAPLNSRRFNNYLKRFKQNVPREAVVIAAYPNWFRFNGWFKAQFTKKEMVAIAEYLSI